MYNKKNNVILRFAQWHSPHSPLPLQNRFNGIPKLVSICPPRLELYQAWLCNNKNQVSSNNRDQVSSNSQDQSYSNSQTQGFGGFSITHDKGFNNGQYQGFSIIYYQGIREDMLRDASEELNLQYLQEGRKPHLPVTVNCKCLGFRL